MATQKKASAPKKTAAKKAAAPAASATIVSTNNEKDTKTQRKKMSDSLYEFIFCNKQK